MVAAACGASPRCPECGARARRVHSCYERCPCRAALVWEEVAGQTAGPAVLLRPGRMPAANVRRAGWRAERAVSALKSRVEDLAPSGRGRVRWAGRRTAVPPHAPRGRTHTVAGAAGSSAGAEASPRILGVDEFAFCRGRTYGTVLVDVQTGRVVDVLPDRTSETFATWLREHPGAEIICRDRATAYTRAIKEAAPDAIEVAGRWHLLQNLSAAVEKTCHRRRSCLRKHVEQEEPPTEPPVIDLPVPELPRTPLVERTRARYVDVHRLLERKWTISAIARHLGLDRTTVRRFKTTPLDELLASAKDFGIHKARLLEPFKPYLNSQFTTGYTSGTRLFHEIRERGYTGSLQVVRRHLAKLREGTAEPVRADIPSPRCITSWIMRPRETLTDQEVEKLLDVRIACLDIARAHDLARCFRDLLVNRRGGMLPDWIRQAEEQDAPAPVRSFAGFLRQDLDAVTAGLTLEWSSGKVEGNVNRIKTIRRTMYGRASFRLLRIRILARI
ncbi:ISL3 family transposase [Streptomyces vinaceus]|uniref:ISL3 family transposase n=1 Tax=Streptomyces vinaceus TaxID=1960 RepID=UPI0037FA32FF